MSQLALARRYRPKTFETVIGQEATLRALKSALDTKRLHHAYLFTGTRGVGKTTLARIFAKALNCEQGISSTPCERCEHCQAIQSGRFIDLIEVDAASRTKVEDTRELLDNVQYLPTQGRFKIYLIDEVHMLSGHSFNALLKTLEEPPSHVKFLLATTDPQKLPITILSRCLQFHLRRLPFSQIVNHSAVILEQEKIPFEQEALEIVARAAEGSVRDALSLLDQAILYARKGEVETGKILASDLRNLLGLTEKGQLLALMSALSRGNAQEMFRVVSELASRNVSFSTVLTEIIGFLHYAAIAQKLPEALDESVCDQDAILSFASTVSANDLQLYYQIGIMGQKDLPYAPTPQMGFEMTLLRMLAFQPVQILNDNAILNKKAVTEQQLTKVVTPKRVVELTAVDSVDSATVDSANSAKAVIEPVVVAGEPITTDTEIDTDTEHNSTAVKWSKLIPKLNLSGMTKELASHCAVIEWSADRILLNLEESKKPLLNKKNEERLQEELSRYLGSAPRVMITVGQANAIKQKPETPALLQQKKEDAALLRARGQIEQDPTVERLIQQFDAKIEQISSTE